MGYFDDIGPQVPAKGYFDDIGPQAPSSTSDVIRSIPQYGETAATSLVGIPGDVANLASQGISYLGGPQMPHYAGSADLQQKLNELQGGQLYQPQTTLGQAGNVAAALLPAALGGPENIALKIGTRVAGPTAAITGIQQSSYIPEEAKPWLESASTLFAPFLGNKFVGFTLKRLGVGVLPTQQQMLATSAALKQAHDTATNPAVQAQALAAWREASRRYESLQTVNSALKGTSEEVRKQLNTLNDEVQQGTGGHNFTPVEQAQLAKAAAAGPRGSGLPSKNEMAYGAAGAATAVASYLATGSPSLAHLIYMGSTGAIALAAKAAYPHLGQSQLDKLVAMVKRGQKVSGAPNYTPVTGGYSPLTPGLAAAPLADQGNQ